MHFGEGKLPTLKGNENQIRDFKWCLEHEPEIVEAHRKAVQGIFECDFNLDKWVLVASRGKQTMGDLTPRNRAFFHRLTDYLKGWWKDNHPT